MAGTSSGWRRLTDRPPIPDQQTQTDAWVAWKNTRFGGNSASAICGYNDYQTAAEVYDRLVHGIVDQKTERQDRFLRWRLAQEPIVAEFYTETQRRKVCRMASAYDEQDPMLVLNPDYQIVDVPGRGVGILEIKTRDPIVWNQIKLKGAPGADWVQTQFYLMVSRLEWASICEANVSSGEQLVIDIEADADFHNALRDRIAAFLDDCEAGKRPAPEESVEDALSIPSVGGDLVLASSMPDDRVSEFYDLARANLVAREVYSQAETFKEDTDEAMKRWMLRNGYDVAEGFGGRFFYREQAGKASFDRKALKRDHPEIDQEKYEKRGAPFRTYKVYSVATSGDAQNERRAINAAAALAARRS